jgi:cytoskeleton protein RodZ
MLQPTSSDPLPTEASEAAKPASARAAPMMDTAWRAGRKLAEARRQRGWSLDEVAERIRVRREFLEALEDMNMKLLPGKAYALAFLRSYARELGIDPQAIVDQFQEESALTREDAQRQIRNPASKPNRERPWLAAAALVVLALGFAGWQALQPPAGKVTAAADAERADSLPPPAQDLAPGETKVIEVRALAEAWIEARGPDGTVFLSRTLRAGDVYRPDPSPGWTLHARDGGAFELYVNGASAGLLGAPGMPVLGRPIDGVAPSAQAESEPSRS